MTRRNDGPLSDINDFAFDAEFEVNKVAIPNSAYPHWLATIANYLGWPLIFGGVSMESVSGSPEKIASKLEMLNTMETPPAWIEYEGLDCPYSEA